VIIYQLTFKWIGLEKAGSSYVSLLKSEPGQTKLTDYYALLDKIENVMQKHPELHKVVTNIDSQRKSFLPNDCGSDFCPLFKRLLENAYQNVNKIPTS